MSTAETDVAIRSDFEPTGGTVIGEAQSSRQAAEVQSAMVIAKRFPRDQISAKTRIEQACQRMSLAEVSQYAYPKGGKKVTGASIRLAEAMAQQWGNLDFGIVELDQRNGVSSVMAYCIDLETNVRQTKTFTVPHVRHTKQGSKRLTDPRDIYEMVANQGARRLRSCILGVIPGDIKDAAIAQCDKTLAGGGDVPLIDRVQKMVAAFSELSVTQEMIEKRLGHNIDVTSEPEFVTLRQIYTSMKDGMSSREQWFEFSDKQVSESDLSQIGKGKDKEKESDKLSPTEIADSYIIQIGNAETQEAVDDLFNQFASDVKDLPAGERKDLTATVTQAAANWSGK